MEKPARILVTGSGVAAAMAAVALARRLPGVAVTHYDPHLPLDPLDDAMGIARPSLRNFLRSIGVDAGEIIARTGSGLQLGTYVEGLGERPFFRGHGDMLKLTAAASTVQQWVRTATEDRGDRIETLLPAAMMADSGRAATPAMLTEWGVDPGFQLGMNAFRTALRALGRAAGVRQIDGALIGVEVDATRHAITMLKTHDGQSLSADIHIDATGQDALVRRALPIAWEDWQAMLPITHLALAAPVTKEPRGGDHDRLTAEAWGWRHTAGWPSGAAAIVGWGHHGAPPATDETDGPVWRIRQGCLTDPFYGNVVAIGSAAVALEPFAATSLHLICRQIDRIIALWPGTRPTAPEIGLVNRRTVMEARRARDFMQAHYLLGMRPEPFWHAAASADPSDALAQDIALFTARGNRVKQDEDSFGADEWAQLLIGLGARPGRSCALAESVSLPVIRQRMDEARRHLRHAVERQPWPDESAGARP